MQYTTRWIKENQLADQPIFGGTYAMAKDSQTTHYALLCKDDGEIVAILPISILEGGVVWLQDILSNNAYDTGADSMAPSMERNLRTYMSYKEPTCEEYELWAGLLLPAFKEEYGLVRLFVIRNDDDDWRDEIYQDILAKLGWTEDDFVIMS